MEFQEPPVEDNEVVLEVVPLAIIPQGQSKVKLTKKDPWSLTDYKDKSTPWNELTNTGKVKRVLLWLLKPVAVAVLLYVFICSLSIMGDAFKLLGGKTAGKALSENELLNNPVCGLMVGILVTVLVQSSSTSTSVVVTMVAAGLLNVQPAIYIVMGANIGTSVTNTIVSMAQSKERDEFRRAFGGATVHDMFNWLAVIIFLPLEALTHFLYYFSDWIVGSFNIQINENAEVELLKVLTKPLTKKIIQINKHVISDLAQGNEDAASESMIKSMCDKKEMLAPTMVTSLQNVTVLAEDDTLDTIMKNITNAVNVTVEGDGVRCAHLFAGTGLSDSSVGAILLVVSLLLLCACLISLVKVLQSMMMGKMAEMIRKNINADFPKPFSFLTGYVAIVVGAGMTFLVQSSSVFTSTITPLVGMGLISLDRMYPLTLGSNIGTTATGILAALSSGSDKFESALQIAICHLLFNICGILVWYPVPFMRRTPIKLAKGLGNTTAKYRWFAIFYLLLMFFVLPGIVFGLSFAGVWYLAGFGIPFVIIVFAVTLINILQTKKPSVLPKILQNWDFLPKCMRSLKPIDDVITKLLSVFRRCCPFVFKPKNPTPSIRPVRPVDSGNTTVVAMTGTQEVHV
ncbi:sodium-dependent phosphate transport protein 2B-like [Anneissia japonica]|uniref:sodium-dependent phosphate transport protein 2B-like n=1 Tax=Anneissia japonica TaxID=1529436 RepID=UPI001425AE1B|nr:sodium-dependent phosphate transport protein 2B-like [Anneissia japonica]